MLRLADGAVVLDRYHVVAPARWEAARGTVALALDERLGRHVDLVVAPQPLGTPLGELFRRRAGAVAVLQHAALPPVLDLGLHAGHVVLVYPHVEGRLLAAVAAQEIAGWTQRRVLQIVADLAAALGSAHAQGLSHGSFSAQSVVLERDGLVTIRDLAWPRPETAVGAEHVAPEVQRGYPPSPRADVYALGQLLWQLLGMGNPAYRREVDEAVAGVVQRATAWMPQQRYADGAALARAIESLLARQPAVERTSVATAPRVARPHPHVVAPAAASRAVRPPPQRPGTALAPLILSLAIGLLPLVGVVAHDVVGHAPGVGFLLHWDDDRGGPGWHGWGQAPPSQQWRQGAADRNGPPWDWNRAGDESGP